MPCYRCGVRQVDPVRGHSPWQRGVRGDQQVLVCPDCQTLPGLAADLDQCRQCGSVRLVRRLGEVECRACGFVVPPDGAVGLPEPPQADAGGIGGRAGPRAVAEPGGVTESALADEVAQALERVFGRTGAKPPASAVSP